MIADWGPITMGTPQLGFILEKLHTRHSEPRSYRPMRRAQDGKAEPGKHSGKMSDKNR
jgi:hypothetical protein